MKPVSETAATPKTNIARRDGEGGAPSALGSRRGSATANMPTTRKIAARAASSRKLGSHHVAAATKGRARSSADGISRARKDERRCERNGEDQRTCEPGPRARRKQRKSDDGQRRAVNSVDCPRRRIFVGPQLQRERQNAGDNQQDTIHRQKRGLLLNHKRVLSSISRPSVSSLGRSASFNSVSRHVNGRVAQSGRPKEWRITFPSDRGAIQALAETK